MFSRDGTKVLTVSQDSPARLWDAASGKELAVFRGHEFTPSVIAFSSDGRTVATGSTDNTARLWDAASGKELTVLRHGSGVTFVAFSPDGGTLATALCRRPTRGSALACGPAVDRSRVRACP